MLQYSWISNLCSGSAHTLFTTSTSWPLWTDKVVAARDNWEHCYHEIFHDMLEEQRIPSIHMGYHHQSPQSSFSWRRTTSKWTTRMVTHYTVSTCMVSQIHCLYIHCRLDTADQLPVLDVESKLSSAASQVVNVHYTVHVCLSLLSTYRLLLVRFLFQTVCDYTWKLKHDFSIFSFSIYCLFYLVSFYKW